MNDEELEVYEEVEKLIFEEPGATIKEIKELIKVKSEDNPNIKQISIWIEFETNYDNVCRIIDRDGFKFFCKTNNMEYISKEHSCSRFISESYMKENMNGKLKKKFKVSKVISDNLWIHNSEFTNDELILI